MWLQWREPGGLNRSSLGFNPGLDFSSCLDHLGVREQRRSTGIGETLDRARRRRRPVTGPIDPCRECLGCIVLPGISFDIWTDQGPVLLHTWAKTIPVQPLVRDVTDVREVAV